MATTEFTAVRFLSLVFQTPDKNHWKPLLIFMIHSFVNFCKIMYKAWACGKQRSVLMYIIPLRPTFLYCSIYSSVQIGRL
jgi:hypothetical protein